MIFFTLFFLPIPPENLIKFFAVKNKINLIFFILKKNNFFRGDGSSKKVNNNIVENLEVILDNTVYIYEVKIGDTVKHIRFIKD